MVGTLERIALLSNGRVMRCERYFKEPVKDVWAGITDPKKMSHWFAHAQFDLRKGSPISLQFDNTKAEVHGTITAVKPPSLFEFTWDDQTVPEIHDRPAAARDVDAGNEPLTNSRVRIQLAKDDGGTMVTLTHTIPKTKAAPNSTKGEKEDSLVNQAVVLASWSHHLDGLAGALAGSFKATQQQNWDWGHWHRLRKKYTDVLSS